MLQCNVKMFHRNTEESSFWYQVVSQIGTAGQTKGQKLGLSGSCFKRIAQLCEIEVEPNYFPWSQFVNLLLSICLVHLWDYLDSATYVVPCLVIYQERIVSTTPIGFQKKLKSRWTWTEGTRPSRWSTNRTDLYYKHKHKRRSVISRIPSCFSCLPKRNFAQR